MGPRGTEGWARQDLGPGTRKNALARGVGSECEGCHPVLCGLRGGLEGKTALYTYQLPLLQNGARAALVSQGYCGIR